MKEDISALVDILASSLFVGLSPGQSILAFQARTVAQGRLLKDLEVGVVLIVLFPRVHGGEVGGGGQGIGLSMVAGCVRSVEPKSGDLK